MSKPDFLRMSKSELKRYLLEHRNDTEAFHALMDKKKAKRKKLTKRKNPRIIEETRGSFMVITRDFKETVNERVQRDPEFVKALFDEAVSLFLNGEPEIARLILTVVI